MPKAAKKGRQPEAWQHAHLSSANSFVPYDSDEDCFGELTGAVSAFRY
jgi:hypothetical protein